MPNRVARFAYSMFAVAAIAGCVPIGVEPETYATVCDDVAEPDCAPDRKVIIEE